MTHLHLYYVHPLTYQLTPVVNSQLLDPLHSGSTDSITAFIQEFIHPNPSKFPIEKTTSTSITLRINKTTNWLIYCDDSTIKIDIHIDTSQISPAVGMHALQNPCPATFVHPDTITSEMADALTSHRQRVFMGVGRTRERELLVTGNVYALISPDQWDNVAAANPQYNIPSYYDIQLMGEVTPIFETVLMGDGNLMSDVRFGTQITGPYMCTVAFASGIRLERNTFTDYMRVHDINLDGSLTFNPRSYAEILCTRVTPIFKHKLDGKFWVPLFGLGIYAEAIKDSDKLTLFTAWMDGIVAAAHASGIQMSQVFLPFWAKFACKPLFDKWVSRNFPVAQHAHEFVQEHRDSSVIFVCGDPVALPGNELAIGMFTESGDPFSMSYLAYLPSVATTPEAVLKCKLTPYHAHCAMLLDAHDSIFGESADHTEESGGTAAMEV